MKLDELPTELLVQICQYFGTGSLSLVNSRLRTISLPTTLRELVVRYPSPEFESVSALLGYHHDVFNVVNELGGFYKVRKIDGLIAVRDSRTRLASRVQGPTQYGGSEHSSSTIMKAFRSIWPSKGGRWQDDWSSFPIVEDNAAAAAVTAEM